jgi:hypothetical protein
MSIPVSSFGNANVTYGSWTNESAGPISAGTPFTITDTGSTFKANSIIVFFQTSSTPVYMVQGIVPDSSGHGHGHGVGGIGSITVVASQPVPSGFTVFFAVINPAA